MSVLDNSRHELFAQHVAIGKPAVEAYKLAGYKPDKAEHNAYRLMENDGICARIEELLKAQENAKLYNAQRLHTRWSEMLDADFLDIVDEFGKYKHPRDWPKVWRQMLTGAEVKEIYEHSKDGGEASWDKIGDVIKLRWRELGKVEEMIGRLKTVDAFVAQGANAKEIAAEVMGEIDKRIGEGRQRAARARIEGGNQ